MFKVTVKEVGATMAMEAEELRMVKAIGPPHPDRRRHGGPSLDFAKKRRTLVEIQRRGRWRSFGSVRRHEKGGRLTQQLQALPKAARESAILAADQIASKLRSQASPAQ